MRKSFQEQSLLFSFFAFGRKPPGMQTSCLSREEGTLSEQLSDNNNRLCTLGQFSDLLQSRCTSSPRSCPDTMRTLLPHFCPPERPACSPHLDDNQAFAKDCGYNTGKEYKKVVGGFTRQPPAAHAQMGMAEALASGRGCRCCNYDCSPLPPNPPG